MSRVFHGILSIVLLSAAVAIAVIFLFSVSVRAGAAYCLLFFASLTVIILGFCAGCNGRKHCPHLITARLAAPFCRKPRPYTLREYLAVAGGLLVIILFPQPWLFAHSNLFIIFWALNGLAIFDILFFLCPGCRNSFCPVYMLMKSLKQSP